MTWNNECRLSDTLRKMRATILEVKTAIDGVSASEAEQIMIGTTWTLKETLGHLVDAASNYQHRIVRLQIEDKLPFPRWRQDDWVRLQYWQQFDWDLLKQLWFTYHCLLCHLVERVDRTKLDHVWLTDGRSISLLEVLEACAAHLRSHADRIVVSVAAHGSPAQTLAVGVE